MRLRRAPQSVCSLVEVLEHGYVTNSRLQEHHCFRMPSDDWMLKSIFLVKLKVITPMTPFERQGCRSQYRDTNAAADAPSSHQFHFSLPIDAHFSFLSIVLQICFS